MVLDFVNISTKVGQFLGFLSNRLDYIERLLTSISVY